MSLPLSQQRIDADGGFVQDEQLRLVEEGDSEGYASLLTAAERLDAAVSGRKVKQFEEKFHLRLDELVRKAVDAAEVFQRLFDGELAVEGKLLRHVTDARTGNSGFRRSGLSAKNQHLAGIEAAPADDAAEQRSLAASGRTQKAVSAAIKFE